MANGTVDMVYNIRRGRPFPVQSFPDLEAAKAYVLSGLDQARVHLLGREHLDRVADGIREVRLLVAADRVPAAMAASAELSALPAEVRQMQARQVQMRRALRLTVVLSLFAFSLAMAFAPAAMAPFSLVVTYTLLPRPRMWLAIGVLVCLFPQFTQAIAAALFLISQVWQYWCIDAEDEALMLREGESVAVETERTVAAVADILRLLN